MIETLYQTPTPEKGKSECYVLVLTSRVSTRGTAYVFMEEHGKWDNDLQTFHYSVKSINTDERLSPQQALHLYETAKCKVAQMGFVHSFDANPEREVACPELRLAPELVSA